MSKKYLGKIIIFSVSVVGLLYLAYSTESALAAFLAGLMAIYIALIVLSWIEAAVKQKRTEQMTALMLAADTSEKNDA